MKTVEGLPFGAPKLNTKAQEINLDCKGLKRMNLGRVHPRLLFSWQYLHIYFNNNLTGYIPWPRCEFFTMINLQTKIKILTFLYGTQCFLRQTYKTLFSGKKPRHGYYLLITKQYFKTADDTLL